MGTDHKSGLMFGLICFGYFCMGACLLCDCIWMYTFKNLSDVTRWMLIHTKWVCSVCVWEWAVKRQVAVYIWLVCVICARSHDEDECRWLACFYWIGQDPPQRHIPCMCTHSLHWLSLLWRGILVFVNLGANLMSFFIVTIDHNYSLTDSLGDIWEHRFQQEHYRSD